MTLQILISTHKEYTYPSNSAYLPIHAGKEISLNSIPYIGDNTGDNISYKNVNYSELTAVYWAWKNIDDVDYIGLCHYRRYFIFNSYFEKQILRLNHTPSELFALNGCLDIPLDILKNNDFVLSKPVDLGKSIYDDYANYHNSHDFDVLGDVIREMHGNYYESYKNLFYNNSHLSPYNMLIASKENYDKYCQWLFPILFEVEKRIDVSKDLYQQRVFGFLGERLLNLYIHHNRYKVKYVPVIKLAEMSDDETMTKKMLKRILRTLNNTFYKIKKYMNRKSCSNVLQYLKS